MKKRKFEKVSSFMIELFWLKRRLEDYYCAAAFGKFIIYVYPSLYTFCSYWIDRISYRTRLWNINSWLQANSQWVHHDKTSNANNVQVRMFFNVLCPTSWLMVQIKVKVNYVTISKSSRSIWWSPTVLLIKTQFYFFGWSTGS